MSHSVRTRLPNFDASRGAKAAKSRQKVNTNGQPEVPRFCKGRDELIGSPSIRRQLVLPLRFSRFHPPREIVSKARERAFKCLAGLANGFAFGR
jgi:hypothetical protein